MIKVSEAVYNGLVAVRDSGETNMIDYQTVMELALDYGYTETVDWMEGHKSEYAKGIFEGFEIGEE